MHTCRKKILVTGASGMLGKDVCAFFEKEGSCEVFGITRTKTHVVKNSIQADLTNISALTEILKPVNPDVIVHCAAMVNVDACETNKTDAENLHIKSTELLASLFPDAVFIYVSTDSVFDGKSGNYTERSTPNPLNYYAKTKYLGEKAALNNSHCCTVLRTNIFGFHIPPGKSLAEWALENLSAEKNIQGFDDVFFNPLYTKTLARIIGYISLGKESYGIINTGCSEKISKYKFLTELSRVFGFNSSLIGASSVKSSSFTAKRPENTTLDVTKMTECGIGHISFYDDISAFYNDYISYQGAEQ